MKFAFQFRAAAAQQKWKHNNSSRHWRSIAFDIFAPRAVAVAATLALALVVAMAMASSSRSLKLRPQHALFHSCFVVHLTLSSADAAAAVAGSCRSCNCRCCSYTFAVSRSQPMPILGLRPWLDVVFMSFMWNISCSCWECLLPCCVCHFLLPAAAVADVAAVAVVVGVCCFWPAAPPNVLFMALAAIGQRGCCLNFKSHAACSLPTRASCHSPQ